MRHMRLWLGSVLYVLLAIGGVVGAQEASRTEVVVTEDAVGEVHETVEALGAFDFSASSAPLSAQQTTIWRVDDEVALARGVAIDDLTVWGGWELNNDRLSAYPIAGDGIPDFEFPVPGTSLRTPVASAKGADRILFAESDGDVHKVHAFTSQSDGTPDWTFEFPTVPGDVGRVAVSYEGSTAAAPFRNSAAQESTLYVFDAETGDVISTWTDPISIAAVDLTDDGSIALVTQTNFATLIDTQTGELHFQTEGGGLGSPFYRISGDGSVFALTGFELQVYAFDGETYQRVIHYGQEDHWSGRRVAVSRDGSTVGTFEVRVAPSFLLGARSPCSMSRPARFSVSIPSPAAARFREMHPMPPRTTTAP